MLNTPILQDLSDPQWQEFRRLALPLSCVLLPFVMISRLVSISPAVSVSSQSICGVLELLLTASENDG